MIPFGQLRFRIIPASINPFNIWQGSLDGGSVHREASTYTKKNAANFPAQSGFRTCDPVFELSNTTTGSDSWGTLF